MFLLWCSRVIEGRGEDKLTIWSEKVLLVTPNLPAGSAYRRWRIIRPYLLPVWPIENGKQLLIWCCHTHFNHPFRNILDHHFCAIFVFLFSKTISCFACMNTNSALVSGVLLCVSSRVNSCLLSLCDPNACLPESRCLDPCRMMYKLLFFRFSLSRLEVGDGKANSNFPSQSHSFHNEEQRLTWDQHNKAASENSLCSEYHHSVSENGIKLDLNLWLSA